jgi:hypothetical protein
LMCVHVYTHKCTSMVLCGPAGTDHHALLAALEHSSRKYPQIIMQHQVQQTHASGYVAKIKIP